MEGLMKFRAVLITPFLSVPSRRTLHGASLNLVGWRKPKDLELDRKLLWWKYCVLKVAQVNFRRRVFDELMQECQIKGENDQEKILTLHSKISILIEKNLVQSCERVIDQLLSQLDPFPFDRSQILEKYQDKNDLSIRQIRNQIERQYLAWMYKVDVLCIRDILRRFSSALYDYRSLKNIQRNVKMLENWPEVDKLSVADKIYYINQIPFSLINITTFQKVTSNLEMELFIAENQKLVYYSHELFLLIFSTLLKKNFRLKQIKEALPFLHIPFPTILRRLNFLLKTPEILKYRNEDKFLILLSCSQKVTEQVVLANSSFEQVLNMAKSNPNEGTNFRKQISVYTTLYFINQFFSIHSNCIETLKKYSKYSCVPPRQLLDTLDFLKSIQISDEELEESLAIIFYPRSRIEEVLEKIELEGKLLDKYGFIKGCLPKETNFFKSGTKQKKKILQLCLYFLEKPFNFSGDGMLQLEAERKLT